MIQRDKVEEGGWKREGEKDKEKRLKKEENRRAKDIWIGRKKGGERGRKREGG